jgi:hypothetical protein
MVVVSVLVGHKRFACGRFAHAFLGNGCAERDSEKPNHRLRSAVGKMRRVKFGADCRY